MMSEMTWCALQYKYYKSSYGVLTFFKDSMCLYVFEIYVNRFEKKNEFHKYFTCYALKKYHAYVKKKVDAQFTYKDKRHVVIPIYS